MILSDLLARLVAGLGLLHGLADQPEHRPRATTGDVNQATNVNAKATLSDTKAKPISNFLH